MKKLFALLLCLVLLVSLVACGGSAEEKKDENASTGETTPSSTPSEVVGEETPSEEAHDHTHVNYKGQESMFTPEDLTSIEGREWDFTYDQNGSTIYIYNNVAVEELNFTQVQFSFNADHNRISCTYTIDKGTDEAPRDAAEIKAEAEEILQIYEEKIAQLYGEGAHTEQHGSHLVSWSDHSGNYVILTQINDTTIQLAYYIYAQEG